MKLFVKNNNCLNKLYAHFASITVTRALESFTRLPKLFREIKCYFLLDNVAFESMTTLSLESFLKGMRADHDMPTVAQYGYRRSRCVEDNASHSRKALFVLYWTKLPLSRKSHL